MVIRVLWTGILMILQPVGITAIEHLVYRADDIVRKRILVLG